MDIVVDIADEVVAVGDTEAEAATEEMANQAQDVVVVDIEVAAIQQSCSKSRQLDGTPKMETDLSCAVPKMHHSTNFLLWFPAGSKTAFFPGFQDIFLCTA
jgi:ABC-type polysaccharide/polyol phosphate transport system ATPase subunit